MDRPRRPLFGVADPADPAVPPLRKYLSVFVLFALQGAGRRWAEFVQHCAPVFSGAARARMDAARGTAPTPDDALRLVLDVLDAAEPGTLHMIDVDTHAAVANSKPQWGRLVWFVIHHICAHSPQPAEAAAAVAAAADLIPCASCRVHFAALLARSPFAESGVSAFVWSARLHNAVSLRIGRPAVPVQGALAP